MLKQHRFYVYHDGPRVLARMEDKKPVVAETCKTPQEAYERVQAIVNPSAKPDTAWGPKGFHEPEFQYAISGNCEKYVKAAYAAKGK